MGGSIIGPRRKLDWANRHLETLRKEAHGFFENYPGEAFAGEYDPVEKCHVFHFHEQKPIPQRWGLMLGDAVASARGSLDHLVWQLVLANGETPGRHNSFPIHITELQWLKSVENRDPKRGKGPLNGVSGNAFAIIKEAQPYQAGDVQAASRTWLWILNRLWNVDKHQVINTSYVMTTRSPTVTVHPKGIASVGPVFDVPASSRLTDGMVLGKVRTFVQAGIKDPQISAHLNQSVAVAFGNPPWVVASGHVVKALKEIDKLFSRLGPEFPD